LTGKPTTEEEASITPKSRTKEKKELNWTNSVGPWGQGLVKDQRKVISVFNSKSIYKKAIRHSIQSWIKSSQATNFQFVLKWKKGLNSSQLHSTQTDQSHVFENIISDFMQMSFSLFSKKVSISKTFNQNLKKNWKEISVKRSRFVRQCKPTIFSKVSEMRFYITCNNENWFQTLNLFSSHRLSSSPQRNITFTIRIQSTAIEKRRPNLHCKKQQFNMQLFKLWFHN